MSLTATKRIYDNIRVLLAEGAFPGKYANAIVEADTLCARILEGLDADIAALTAEQEAPSEQQAPQEA